LIASNITRNGKDRASGTAICSGFREHGVHRTIRGTEDVGQVADRDDEVVAAIELDVATLQMRERVVAHSAIFDQPVAELLHRTQVKIARLFTS